MSVLSDWGEAFLLNPQIGGSLSFPPARFLNNSVMGNPVTPPRHGVKWPGGIPVLGQPGRFLGLSMPNSPVFPQAQRIPVSRIPGSGDVTNLLEETFGLPFPANTSVYNVSPGMYGQMTGVEGTEAHFQYGTGISFFGLAGQRKELWNWRYGIREPGAVFRGSHGMPMKGMMQLGDPALPRGARFGGTLINELSHQMARTHKLTGAQMQAIIDKLEVSLYQRDIPNWEKMGLTKGIGGADAWIRNYWTQEQEARAPLGNMMHFQPTPLNTHYNRYWRTTHGVDAEGNVASNRNLTQAEYRHMMNERLSTLMTAAWRRQEGVEGDGGGFGWRQSEILPPEMLRFEQLPEQQHQAPPQIPPMQEIDNWDHPPQSNETGIASTMHAEVHGNV